MTLKPNLTNKKGPLYRTLANLLEEDIKNAGVQVYCAERFALGNTPVPVAVRLSIAAPKDLNELEKGLNILKTILKHDDTFTML